LLEYRNGRSVVPPLLTSFLPPYCPPLLFHSTTRLHSTRAPTTTANIHINMEDHQGITVGMGWNREEGERGTDFLFYLVDLFASWLARETSLAKPFPGILLRNQNFPCIPRFHFCPDFF
jgi:hypothetical protein